MTEIRRHTFDGSFSITFDCDTPVDATVEHAGHEPNGYFWEGIAQVLVASEASHLEPEIDYDPEGSMFCAVSENASALEELAQLLVPTINSPDRVSAIISTAKLRGFEFDD